MAMNRGPHVRDLFIGQSSAGFEYEGKEGKKKYNLNGKGKSGGFSQLGAYKPKILSNDGIGNIAIDNSPKPEHSDRDKVGKVNKAFIIGDKDIPMTIEPSENIYSEIQETYTASSSDAGDQFRSNPIFNDSATSPTLHHGNVYREQRSQSRPSVPSERIGGMDIPAPDYEEEEMTLDFEGDDLAHAKRRSSIYKEFPGEDFSRYLSDDEEEYEFDRPIHTVRSKPPVSRKVLQKKESSKSRTEARRVEKPKRDSTKTLFKQNAKNSGKTTLRYYSVNDTKLGIGVDGTVRKQQKKSLRDGVPYESSYESFLQSRNGGPRWGSLESASSDSGHETGDDIKRGVKGRDKNGTFWKKLTIKFKQTGYNLKH
ncbi:uncharacterized protein LOC124119636 [Haliotis rufescens]|uniref:uncharacterized protein LOC124119636 n=1 Tax=Haliotis rufescens TaxID=6454 RepID=UPI001EAFCBEE|nr:uncharacterized protein LOC124119636 [Haliotis rufescens]XP_046338179.1 uncharacterized protein LOC124119636 [Haliotis rufescens]XP_046338180.1 uncharacterized protein LOC124119636 [Haliotis rufescens]XP_046338181.1 uncharacterized protein LOC124119636 [Haliotis rufescens]XP_046338182.1 uncharacterized protein LOC124119636 [Haliotis rufescens]XP_046338183.1 uncharacterized protein LOC124119636 [Haliotis rufescens]XP_046338184.1 uncharacterized protein LOC124119636 [Haliotis rufescens]XP_0